MSHQIHTDTDAEFNDKLHSFMVKEADELKAREVKLAEAVKDARAYLDSSVNTIRAAWMDWNDQSKKALEDLRLFKIAVGSETRQIQQYVKDLSATLETHRQSFDGAKDVIAHLERLKALDESGFLVKLNETLLKLL